MPTLSYRQQKLLRSGYAHSPSLRITNDVGQDVYQTHAGQLIYLLVSSNGKEPRRLRSRLSVRLACGRLLNVWQLVWVSRVLGDDHYTRTCHVTVGMSRQITLTPQWVPSVGEHLQPFNCNGGLELHMSEKISIGSNTLNKQIHGAPGWNVPLYRLLVLKGYKMRTSLDRVTRPLETKPSVS